MQGFALPVQPRGFQTINFTPPSAEYMNKKMSKVSETAKQAPSKALEFCKSMAVFIITLVLVAGVVACTISFTVVLSNQSNDVSGQLLVHTGRRTRDWGAANSYSMHSSDEDEYSRFYVCMKSAGVEVPGNPAALWNYRAAARSVFDCGVESDKGWPKDIGFLRCMQKRFTVSFHQSNLFLQCLELTEGVMLENVQTATSTLFLGSYNYAAFLLAAMGVMAAFLLFTAGGVYRTSEIKLNEVEQQEIGEDGTLKVDESNNPIMKWVPNNYNYVASSWEWAPLAAVPNFLALVWSLVMLVFSMLYTYPPKDFWSDAVSVDGGSSSFPGTPWTGRLCTSVSFLMCTYFASCLGEWYYDRKARIINDENRKFIERINNENKRARDERREAMRAVKVLPSDGRIIYVNKDGPGNFDPPVQDGIWSPEDADNAARYTFGPDFLSRKFMNIHGYDAVHLGVRFNSQLSYATRGDMSQKLTPLLNKVYALGWVFADGLLFVGMINSQNSPLVENVVAVWFFILMCRSFQFVGTYFLDDVLFNGLNYFDVSDTGSVTGMDSSEDGGSKLLHWVNRASSSEHNLTSNLVNSKFNLGITFNLNPSIGSPDYKKELYKQKIHAGLAVLCSQLASLWCMIIVIYHFTNAISIPEALFRSGIKTDVHVIQACFIAFMLAMDLLKHVAAFATLWGSIKQNGYWYWMTTIFTLDWVIRAVFIICMLFPITHYFGVVGRELHDYIKTTVA